MEARTRKKILVVEDDPDAATLAQYSLQQEGYEVVIATDGEAGLEMATTDEEIDLIVLAIMLPGMNGYEVCQQLRLQPETEKLPVLMLTAKAGKQDKLTGLAMAEANVYLTKPADPATFVKTVKALLRKYPNPRTTVTGAPSTRVPD